MGSTIFTIGYGGLEPSKFLVLLKQHSIRSVIDIRIRPNRASMGSYVLSKAPDKGIQGLLKREGISYFSFLELGNPFLDLPDWKERYKKLIDAAGRVLIERLHDTPGPICLLCAEKDPDDCHRWLLATFLQDRGQEVQHIVV